MDQPSCSVCLDLSHDLFESGDQFPHLALPGELRYRTIQFHDLRTAVAAGCPSCSILDQGIRLFWGTSPEDWECCDDDGPALLVLESRPGKSLVAFKSKGGTPVVGIRVSDMRIEFFRQDSLVGDNPFPMIGHARHVSRSLSKDAMVSCLRTWLRACGENHACSSSLRQKLPTRLLELSGDIPRLVESRDIKNYSGRYVTLSHCWGDSSSSRPTTITTTTKQQQQNKLLSLARAVSLPANYLPFSEMRLSYAKGLAVITSGSIHCVLSKMMTWTGRRNHRKWPKYTQTHISTLPQHDVSIAPMTCSRTDGPTKDAIPPNGCLVQDYLVGVCLTPDHPIYARISHDRDHRYVQAGDISSGRQDQAPLLTRAWVLQEVLLARRVLHVCASELIWEWEDLYDCECGSISSAASTADLAINRSHHRKREFAEIRDGRESLSTNRVRDFWLEISAAYSSLSITKPSDRPVALAGLADAVQGPSSQKFCYGILIDDLPRALMWRGRSELRIYDSALRLGDMPSWSWMSGLLISKDYHIAYNLILHGGFIQEPRTSLSITLRNQEEESSSGEKMQPQSITFRGPVLLERKVEVREIDGDIHYHVHLSLDSTPQSYDQEGIDMDSLIYADCPMWPEDPLCDGDMVACLLFGRNENCSLQHVLVVKICPDMERERIVYCRRVGIGLPDLFHNGPYIDRFEDAEIKTMRII